VHRWEETCDVLQNSLLRLYRSLADTRPSRTVDFFRLAALNIRRELHDLAKHYYGPRGVGANYVATVWDGQVSPMATNRSVGRPPTPVKTGESGGLGGIPCSGRAPTRARARTVRPSVVQELSQSEAAALLNVSERTLKRRWAAARLRLHKMLVDTLPDLGCKPDVIRFAMRVRCRENHVARH